MALMVNSNTTLVKVKYLEMWGSLILPIGYSNTTLVKVK